MIRSLLSETVSVFCCVTFGVYSK